jgi:hypothetical protein
MCRADTVVAVADVKADVGDEPGQAFQDALDILNDEITQICMNLK